MSLILQPLIEVFRFSLAPISPFTWFGWNISTLDVVATVRLCVVLRQIREIALKQHITTKGGNIEEQSFVKKASTTLLVVYGGEAVVGMCLCS